MKTLVYIIAFCAMIIVLYFLYSAILWVLELLFQIISPFLPAAISEKIDRWFERSD